MIATKLPVSVRIFGKRWDIEVRKDQDDFGQCHFDDTKITYKPGQSLENLRDTLLHEIIHGISNEMKDGVNEKQTATLACGILCVLRDNPGLVRFLTD